MKLPMSLINNFIYFNILMRSGKNDFRPWKLAKKTINGCVLEANNPCTDVYEYMSRKSMKILIWMQKSTVFHFPHYEFPQLLPALCTPWDKIYIWSIYYMHFQILVIFLSMQWIFVGLSDICTLNWNS